MKKLLISCLILVCSFSNVWGQKTDITEPLSLADKMINMVITLRKKCDTFLFEERTNKIRRRLGYLRDDLRRYRLERDEFMVDLISNNYMLSERKMRRHVKKIKSELKDLLVSVDRLDKYLSLNLSISSGKSTREIIEKQLQKSDSTYTELDRLIKGEAIDIPLLEQNAKEIYEGLEQCEISIGNLSDSFIKEET